MRISDWSSDVCSSDLINFSIPPKLNVGLVGRNCAGKSTLLSIIGGVDQPTRGVVKRHCLVSWPMGFGGGLQGSLTGRQNTKFVCRIHGQGHLIPEKIDYVQELDRKSTRLNSSH